MNDIGLKEVAERYGIPIQAGDSRGGKRDKCPFCGSTTGFRTKENKFYKCYRCGEKGGIISLLSKYQSIDSREAYKMLRRLAPVPLITTRKGRSLYDAFNLYRNNAIRNSNVVREFFESRGINPDILQQYPVGLANSNKTLQTNGWTLDEIRKVGLLTSSNRELYYDHIVFPFYSYNGEVTHVQGRNLDNSSEARWVSIINNGGQGIDSVLFNKHLLKERWGEPFVVLCEGLTDTYSVLSLGLDALGTTGVNVKLSSYADMLMDRDVLVVLDVDRYENGHKDAGQYKSWGAMFRELIELQRYMRGEVYCLLLPEDIGIKDVNEYLNAIEWDKNRFLEYVEEHKQTLVEFAAYIARGSKRALEYIVGAAAIQPDDYNKELVRASIEQHYNDPIDYILDSFVYD